MAKKMLSAARKDLLIRLETMIGSECYNANIQNWGPGGTFEGSGRDFRYPVTFRDSAGSKRKLNVVPPTLPDDMLIGGYYAFGANELHVMAALNHIINLLEREYGLVVEKTE